MFSQTEHCTQTFEATDVKEQRWRLSDPVRGAFAAGAGLIVAVPLIGLTLTANQPQVQQRSASIDYVQPAYSSVPSRLAEPIIYGVLLGSIGMAMAAYDAMKGSDPRPSIQVVEQTSRPLMRERVVSGGMVHAPGLEVTGLQLSQGVLDLPLDQAVGLADGELYLDGQRVELVGNALERLSFLPICKRAVDGYTGLPAWDVSQRALMWRLADACDRRGWTFAEDVRVNAIAAAP